MGNTNEDTRVDANPALISDTQFSLEDLEKQARLGAVHTGQQSKSLSETTTVSCQA